MKKVFIVFILNIFVILHVYSDQFSDGFKKGYITGYKQSSGSSFDPFVPFTPFQPFKSFNDPESDFEHGYIIGYERGKKEGSN